MQALRPGRSQMCSREGWTVNARDLAPIPSPVTAWSQVSPSTSPAKQVSGLLVPKQGWGSACTHSVQPSRWLWTVSSDWSGIYDTVIKYFQCHPHCQVPPCEEKSLARLWKTDNLAFQKQKSPRHSSKASTYLIINITPDDSRSSCHEP